MFEQFQAHPIIEDEQARRSTSPELSQCTDGVMRTGYDRTKFEERVEWRWLGFRVRPERYSPFATSNM